MRSSRQRPFSAPAHTTTRAAVLSNPEPGFYMSDPAALSLYEQRAKLLFELGRAQVRASQELESAHR